MSSVVWVDIPCLDLDRAIKFYAAVLGRDVEKVEGGPGFQLGILPHVNDSVGGCLFQADGDQQPSDKGPLVYLNAAGRLDEATAAAEANGGTVLEKPHQIGPHGFRSVVRDPEGNRIALHSPPK